MKIIREFRFAQGHMNLSNTSHNLTAGNYFFAYRNQKLERDREREQGEQRHMYAFKHGLRWI